MRMDESTLKAIATALNFRQMRHELITSNIANAETPGYKAKRLDFEDALARALDIDKQNSMQVNDPKHFNVGGGGFANLEPDVYQDPNGIASEDGNTVDRDDELARMAENRIMYNAAVEVLNKKIGLMKYVLNSER